MLEIGIFAKTFKRQSVLEVCQAVRHAGFPQIQFNMACAGLPSLPDAISPIHISDIQQALARTKLSVAGISGTFNMCHPDPKVRQDGLRRLEVLAQSCHAIGTHLISLCTGTRDPLDKWTYHPDNPSPAAWRDLCASMERALDIAERHDLFLGIEPELANVVDSAAKAKQLLEEMNSHRLTIILDPANLFEKASITEIHRLIDEAIELLGPHIIMAHAKGKDAHGQFVPPGQGIIPFPYFLNRLLAHDLSPPLIAHGFSERDVHMVQAYLTTL
ncbi:MAG: sugar phosphate isomerase/epimerase family protein [Bacteroidota bacterium]